MKTLLDEIMEVESPRARSKGSCGCGCPSCSGSGSRQWRSYETGALIDEILYESNADKIASAVAFNRKRADQVGWGPHRNAIVTRILKLNYTPDESNFAVLVADWQFSNGLIPDGKLGTDTWAGMKNLLTEKPAVASGAKVFFPSGEYLIASTGETGTGQEHWDVLGSGNPLLDTSGSNKDKFLSKNFQVKEFSKNGDKARIDIKLVECLQKLRDALGKSINITSGYRSYGYNKRLYEGRGQTPTKSQHISGRAVDIKVSGLNGLQLAKEAIKACGCDVAIGLGWTFIHLDVRGKYTPGYTFTTWDYGNGGLDSWIAELKQFQRSWCR